MNCDQVVQQIDDILRSVLNRVERIAETIDTVCPVYENKSIRA